MRMYRHGVFLLLAGALLAGVATAGVEPDKSAADRIAEFLAAGQHPPVLYKPDPAQPYPAERTFLFDEVLSLEPEALLEAVRATLEHYPGPADPEAQPAYARGINEKLQAFFEYYPLLAKTPLDFQRLTDAIASGANPPLLRVFLLEHAAPELRDRSALGEYMQGMLARDGDAFDAGLAELVRNITEPPPVQAAAIRVLGARITGRYAALLAADPLARAYGERNGAAPHARMLIASPDAIPLSRRTQIRLKRENEAAGQTAAMLVTVLRDPNRGAAVQEAAGAVAAAIARDYPIPNRDEVLAGLPLETAPRLR